MTRQEISNFNLLLNIFNKFSEIGEYYSMPLRFYAHVFNGNGMG